MITTWEWLNRDLQIPLLGVIVYRRTPETFEKEGEDDSPCPHKGQPGFLPRHDHTASFPESRPLSRRYQGLSPLVETVLLVVVTIALAVVLFLMVNGIFGGK